MILIFWLKNIESSPVAVAWFLCDASLTCPFSVAWWRKCFQYLAHYRAVFPGVPSPWTQTHQLPGCSCLCKSLLSKWRRWRPFLKAILGLINVIGNEVSFQVMNWCCDKYYGIAHLYALEDNPHDTRLSHLWYSLLSLCLGRT